ncbi:chitinase [Cryptosporangium aurantiacum]|uniref:Glycosyl hydrolases family 18 n=1 Tax=Cryptosporangium aurantiacum TaxID=134849 RepID=A0A1M7RND6_9ACTN|nr:chitinase [Cryptosporangium aurantiacum]SHN47586.1 Glycosyl hydrolases family 18 [Cryptosporangium aurantiacum]
MTTGAYAAVGPTIRDEAPPLAEGCSAEVCDEETPSTDPAPSADSRPRVSRSHLPPGVGKSSPTPKPVGSDGTEFAPYVDVLQYSAAELVAVRKAGITHLNLAFIISGSGCSATWDGATEVSDASVKSKISAFRGAGGQVRISFGGESGTELAASCSSAEELAAAYQGVIDTYSATRVDFDVEGGVLTDSAANDRRSQAITILQRTAAAAGKSLDVSVTLPVNPTGLTADGVSLLNSAASNGATIHAVNVMAMDFGDSAAPDPDGRMGYYAIQSMKATQKQVKSAFGLSDSAAWSRVAVTTLIGVNEPATEVFTATDAKQLTAFARSVGAAWVSMWQLARDQPCTDGTEANASSDACSGASDSKYAVAKAFLA